ncbi:hypothetical protein MMC31_005488, partial [Peltigera leucophlebia]|nr:hypothetical protein [Peltigera leucophlebia]
MPLEVYEVKTDADWDEIVLLQVVSYETPFNPFLVLFASPLGSREEIIQETKVRQRQWHEADPTSRWIKVVDNETGKAIGGAQWNIHETNPYAKPPEKPLSAYWWPGGEEREYVEQALGQWMTPRVQRMNKPHLLLNICFVHPEHRRRGAASKLVKWGTNTADELGVESFVESTEDGRPLYLRHGFHVTNEFDLAPKKENPGEEWKKLDKKLRPMHGYFMWRPIR